MTARISRGRSVICGAALFTFLAAGGGAVAAAEGADSREQIVFLTWADYLDPEIVTAFEEEHGIDVKFAYYESDDGRDEMLANNDGRGYDLAVVNGLRMNAYTKRNWLAPVPVESISNLQHIEARWRDAFPGSARYGVPYFWGTLGIAYRSDLVPEGFTSWKDLFEPRESLRGRIAMLRSSRDLLGMALKSLGHSANTDDRDAVRAAATLLEAQKPYVRTYEYVSLEENSALVSGEIWVSLMYSGDALMVQEHNENIRYVVPEEGGNLWVDYIAILQSSPRKDLAAKFIDFLNRPAIAARNAEFVYYATPNMAARPYLSQEYFANDVIHPSESVMSRSETYREFAPRTQKAVNSAFARLVN